MECNVHQIWVGPYDMPAKEAGLVAGIRDNLKLSNPGWTHHLWTDANMPVLPARLKELWDIFAERRDYAFQSDILRVYLVYEYGGLYLDTDHRWINGICDLPLDTLDAMYVGHWGQDYTLANCCFAAARHSRTITYLYEDIHLPGQWYGPSWQGDTLHRMYGLPTAIDHDAFKLRLAADNVLYMKYSDWCREYFHHGMHYTWSPENKRRFKEGAYK